MRSKQRGFIYLTTGANGAGKTLFTIKEVQERAVKESRPVCYNGGFALNPDGPLKSWKLIDIRDWQKEPDGTIFVVDEAHNDFPARGKGEPPEYVRMLAEHRRRGMDFYIIDQHPMNIDNFVRRLIGSPGWHRHLKRTFGADLVSRIEWPAVNTQAEKPGSSKSGTVSMVPFPKEVYSWYSSAQLHTGKTRIPRAVYVVGVCVLLGPIAGWFAYKGFTAQNKARADAMVAKVGGAAAVPGGGVVVAPRGAGVAGTLSAAEYLQARKPRIEGLAYSAPVYDSVTQPTAAPYPAACVVGRYAGAKGDGCKCYTQQGTVLPVVDSLCRSIVAGGFFVDWAQAQEKHQSGGVIPTQQVAPSNVGQAQPERPPVAMAPRPAAGASAAAAPVSTAPVYFGPLVQDERRVDGRAASDGAMLASMRSNVRYSR